VCKKIKSDADTTVEGNVVPETVQYMGQNVQVMWNFVKWDPTMECAVTEQRLINGPTKCSDQDNCSIEYTYTKRKTKSWTASNGGTVSGSYGMEFDAGIPLIEEIKTNVEMGAEYSFGLDISGQTEIEQSETQHLACGNYQGLMINCYIFAIVTTFNTTAMVSPQFWIVKEGQTERSLVDCNAEYNINLQIAWKAETGHGYEARDVPVCTDTINACGEADKPKCMGDPFTIKNCPATCASYGLGPSPCPSDATCGFTKVPAGECPAPADLTTSTAYKDCLTVFNGPPTLCQATMNFPAGSGPEEWNIQNCPDLHGHKHNIFSYDCQRAEDAQRLAIENYSKTHGTEQHSMTVSGSSASHEDTGLHDKEVEKAFDVIDGEAEEIRKFNARLVKVNRVLRAALEDLAN